MRLSIIIPAYNVESTLQRCLDSVLCQSFSDYEILLIDDGSYDTSPSICDDYAFRFKQIQAFHKINGGLSDSRNYGLNKAIGDYITFIDSDDYIADGTLQELMEITNIHPEYDIIEYSIYERYGNIKQQHLNIFHEHVYDNVTSYWFDTQAYLHTYAWNKVYKRNLLNNIRFPIGKLFEDIFTLPIILKKKPLIATTSKGLYYYYYNPNGITATANVKAMEDLLNAHIQLINTDFSPIKSATYYSHVLNIQLDVFELSGKDPILPKYTSWNKKCSYKIILSKLIGIKRLCQINNIIHKIFRRNH